MELIYENFTTLCLSQFQEKYMNVMEQTCTNKTKCDTLMVCDKICQSTNIFFHPSLDAKEQMSRRDKGAGVGGTQ